MSTRTTPSTSTPAQPSTSRSDGLVGVFATLADQHAQAAKLFEQIQRGPARRAALWPELRRALISHEHAEVRELYPVLRQYDQTQAMADAHDLEAGQLDGLIGRLDTTPIESEPWGAAFDELVATVLHHAKEVEEQQIFPVAQSVLGQSKAMELDQRVRVAHQQLAAAN